MVASQQKENKLEIEEKSSLATKNINIRKGLWALYVEIMPHGQTKFNPDWLSLQDANGDKMVDYFVPGEDQFHARCVICNKTVSVSGQGKGE